jgi:hypothetical protein
MLYTVYTREVHVQGYEVEADSEQEAIRKIEDMEGSLIEDYFEFSHMLDSSTWTAELL